MDGLYKAAALLGTQAYAAARVAAALPGCLVSAAAAAAAGSPKQQQERQEQRGVVYYEGRVTHARRRPVENSFEYAVHMALVDLDAPPAWFAAHQAADHMTAGEARAFAGTDGRVLLLTTPVVAGYTQNPISVYFCHQQNKQQQQQQTQQAQQAKQQQEQQQQTQQQEEEQQEQQLVRGIAEVTNTPWGERVTFAFDPAGDASPKALHVSPFMDMRNAWRLRAALPPRACEPLPGGRPAAGEAAGAAAGEEKQQQQPPLSVSVLVSHPEHGAYFDAYLLLRRCPPERQCAPERGGWAMLLRYGFMPQRVALWIYWQAVRLVAKGCPVYAKPAPESFQPRVSEGSAVPCNAATGARYTWRAAQQWPWYL